jgi:protein-S-isoprenylcysteine O-methyltransferase Ste14
MSVTLAISIGLYALFYAFWGILALNVKRSARSEAMRSQVTHQLLVIAAYALALWDRLGVGPLGVRFEPDGAPFGVAGLLIQAAGLALAAWARLLLGRNWGGSTAIKEQHQFVRSGPYAIVRHPIYAGIALAMAGTAIAVGKWRGVVAVVLVVIAFLYRINLEESYLNDEFGGEYVRYQREVKALIPFAF